MAKSKPPISKTSKSAVSSHGVLRKQAAATVRVGDVKSSGRASKGTRGAMQAFIARLRNLSPEEFDASLHAAGIITKSGELAKPYRG